MGIQTQLSGGVAAKLEEEEETVGRLLGDLVRYSLQQARPLRCATLLTDHRYVSVTPRPLITTPILRYTTVQYDNTSLITEALQLSRMQDCPLVAMFMENSRHLARILKRADRLEKHTFIKKTYDSLLDS
jgi:hypothetical protein